MIPAVDRRGDAPPITGRFAAPEIERGRRPRRLHRPRWRKAVAPRAVYVGRPSLWSNPFEGRHRIGHARGVILYRAWLQGELTPRILACAGFGNHEIAALGRWRQRLLDRLARLAGRDLQCPCPLGAAWCHADVLISLSNESQGRDAPGPELPNPAAVPAAAGNAGSRIDRGTNPAGTGD